MVGTGWVDSDSDRHDSIEIADRISSVTPAVRVTANQVYVTQAVQVQTDSAGQWISARRRFLDSVMIYTFLGGTSNWQPNKSPMQSLKNSLTGRKRCWESVMKAPLKVQLTSCYVEDKPEEHHVEARTWTTRQKQLRASSGALCTDWLIAPLAVAWGAQWSTRVAAKLVAIVCSLKPPSWHSKLHFSLSSLHVLFFHNI